MEVFTSESRSEKYHRIWLYGLDVYSDDRISIYDPVSGVKPGNESLLGWLGSSVGAGAVFIILLLNRLPRLGYGWGLGGGYFLIGAGIAALGWVGPDTTTAWIIVLGLCIGLGNGLFMVTMNYLLQKRLRLTM